MKEKAIWTADGKKVFVKARKITVGGKTYNLALVADLMEAVTAMTAEPETDPGLMAEFQSELAAIPAEVRAAAARALDAARREATAPQAEGLTGRVVRRTEKAVLFCSPDLPGVGQCWFPLSQVAVYERAMGDLDQITVPPWLLEAKRNELAAAGR